MADDLTTNEAIERMQARFRTLETSRTSQSQWQALEEEIRSAIEGGKQVLVDTQRLLDRADLRPEDYEQAKASFEETISALRQLGELLRLTEPFIKARQKRIG